jgi:hypothetical protein
MTESTPMTKNHKFPLGTIVQPIVPNTNMNSPVAYKVTHYDNRGAMCATGVWGSWQRPRPSGVYDPSGGETFVEVNLKGITIKSINITQAEAETEKEVKQ